MVLTVLPEATPLEANTVRGSTFRQLILFGTTTGVARVPLCQRVASKGVARVTTKRQHL